MDTPALPRSPQIVWGSSYQVTSEASEVEWKGGTCWPDDQATLESFFKLGGRCWCIIILNGHIVV